MGTSCCRLGGILGGRKRMWRRNSASVAYIRCRRCEKTQIRGDEATWRQSFYQLRSKRDERGSNLPPIGSVSLSVSPTLGISNPKGRIVCLIPKSLRTRWLPPSFTRLELTARTKISRYIGIAWNIPPRMLVPNCIDEDTESPSILGALVLGTYCDPLHFGLMLSLFVSVAMHCCHCFQRPTPASVPAAWCSRCFTTWSRY
ncbi:hypothetical protein CPB85DRAFT_19529 [Mucidula mucida]|nr:hypothetical protein CPB85DRAFT_19529 [Mucidula mucida]